ncbi:MAG: response regulator, partial [Bdellovibrionota bacterium]
MTQLVNVLLVDDRPEGLIALEAVLADPEINLIKAASGQEALAQILSHDFAVILLDVQMPEMDGFETASIIKQRERSRNIPIIFMTANNKADHYISTGYSVGAVDYVLKPFDPHMLKSKVNVFVDLYKKTRLIREQAEALRESVRREQANTLHQLELEGRRRYQNLADAVPQIVFRAQSSGGIEYINQYWLSYTGRSLNESLDENWRTAVHSKDLVLIDNKWNEAKKLNRGFECECRLRSGTSGEFRWHLLRVVPEFNGYSQLSTWLGVATEIHDQKIAQQELLLAKKIAESASETKSRFLANMSHEIRTPLGVILGFSELLMDSELSEEERSSALTTIRKNGEQLSKIIDEILDLSKVEAGKMEVERSKISVVDLLMSVKSFMSLPASEKGIKLKFDTVGKIPSFIFTDATRLQQILINLISNGIKFSAGGEIHVSIWFEKKPVHSKLFISVKDTGPGLSAEQIENLFQPFTQVDTSMTRKHGGTGLGLALSRKFARALGGDIKVAPSAEGEGCNFILQIETGLVDETTFVDKLAVEYISPVKKGAQSTALNGVKVLLVEDSVDNQVLVSRFLTREGAIVDLASNGVEGVQKAMGGDHNLVLMDIQMPELDGYGAISQLRQKGFTKPIIALTAHGMVEDRQKCLAIGLTDHLTKPVNRKALV